MTGGTAPVLELRDLRTHFPTRAGIVRAVLASDCEYLPETITQLRSAAKGAQRQWLLYLVAASGRERSEPHLRATAPELLDEVQFFWTHQADNWTNRLDVADQLDFLRQQFS